MSFVKGNLAARAISVTYLTLRDSLRAAIGEAILFEHNITKIAAITGASSTITSAFEKSVSSLVASTKQSHNELATTALEMTKMGLSASQTINALDGVAKLARALDEDLVRTGQAVVAVLNTYGLSADQADKITNQLAFTVKASALSIESFSTAFSYVGGTAAAAGVSLTELQGAMDVLSNSGIRSSTIGTQLRRIIADLSDENSKAGQLLGGQTLQSYGSLEKTLEALAQKHLTASDLTEIFGRTASSVAAILIKYRDVMGDLGKQTDNVGNIVDGMTQKMNTTMKSSIDSVKGSWTELGVQFMKSAGIMKSAVDKVDEALRTLSERMELKNQISKFKKEAFSGYVYATQQVGTNDNSIAAHPVFQKWLQMERESEALALRMDNIVEELKKTLSRDKGLLESADSDVQKIPIENTFLFKKLAAEYAGAGHSKSEFLTKLMMARDALMRELMPTPEDSGLPEDFGKKAKADKAIKHMILSKGDPDHEAFGRPKDSEIRAEFSRIAEELQVAAKANDAFNKSMVISVSTGKEYTDWLNDQKTSLEALNLSQQAVNDSIDIFSSFLAEGLLSDKKDPFKGISDAFGNFAKQMLADLAALIIKLLVFKAVLAMLGGGAGPGGFFSMAFNPTGSGGKDFLLGALGGQKFASGTDQMVDRPTLFMAGEAGRERVQVTPRAKVGSRGGNSIVVNIQGDVYGGEKFTEAVALAEKKLNRKMI